MLFVRIRASPYGTPVSRSNQRPLAMAPRVVFGKFEWRLASLIWEGFLTAFQARMGLYRSSIGYAGRIHRPAKAKKIARKENR